MNVNILFIYLFIYLILDRMLTLTLSCVLYVAVGIELRALCMLGKHGAIFLAMQCPFFYCHAGKWTQGLIHVRQVLYHWTTPLSLTHCLDLSVCLVWVCDIQHWESRTPSVLTGNPNQQSWEGVSAAQLVVSGWRRQAAGPVPPEWLSLQWPFWQWVLSGWDRVYRAAWMLGW